MKISKQFKSLQACLTSHCQSVLKDGQAMLSAIQSEQQSSVPAGLRRRVRSGHQRLKFRVLERFILFALRLAFDCASMGFLWMRPGSNSSSVLGKAPSLDSIWQIDFPLWLNSAEEKTETNLS
jgi:hypothetical protein